VIPQISYADYTIKGLLDCELWLKARLTNRSENLETAVQSFVNGFNAGRNGKDLWYYPNKMTVDQVFYYVDSKCSSNAQESVYTILSRYLDSRSGRKF
jgi:hypothetical protein